MARMNIRQETWEPIECFNNYLVSDRGRVKNIKKNKILKTCPDSHGYPSAHLHNKLITVHKLVLEAFVGKRPAYMQCNHIDCNKKNNDLNNLEWVTPSENQKHAFRNGLYPDQKGEKNYNSKLNNDTIVAMRELAKLQKANKEEIAEIFGMHPHYVYKILRRDIWRNL